ncbi:MAG: hypothetical protein AAF092_03585 [Pseudomonadota bacterium]
MRRAAEVDANQGEIVSALRAVRASVRPTHREGQGFPDVCVGYRDMNFLIEIKDVSKPPSARKLTTDEQEWHDTWRGKTAVATSVDEALAIIGVGPLDSQPVPLVGKAGVAQ